jgi:7-cyano-7-deazaguanine synthase in queuosine biosynthesis
MKHTFCLRRRTPLINQDCAYWSAWARQFYNRGGALPCKECPACKEDTAALARVTKWNEDTARGASPTR